jgi:hypothetical protein
MPVDPRLSTGLASQQQQGPSMMEMATRALQMRSAMQQYRARGMEMKRFEEDQERAKRTYGLLAEYKDTQHGTQERKDVIDAIISVDKDTGLPLLQTDLAQTRNQLDQEAIDIDNNQRFSSKYADLLGSFLAGTNKNPETVAFRFNQLSELLGKVDPKGGWGKEMQKGLLETYGPPPEDTEKRTEWIRKVQELRTFIEPSMYIIERKKLEVDKRRTAAIENRNQQQALINKREDDLLQGKLEAYYGRSGPFTLAETASGLSAWGRMLTPEEKQREMNKAATEEIDMFARSKNNLNQARQNLIHKRDVELISESEFRTSMQMLDEDYQEDKENITRVTNNKYAVLHPDRYTFQEFTLDKKEGREDPKNGAAKSLIGYIPVVGGIDGAGGMSESVLNSLGVQRTLELTLQHMSRNLAILDYEIKELEGSINRRFPFISPKVTNYERESLLRSKHQKLEVLKARRKKQAEDFLNTRRRSGQVPVEATDPSTAPPLGPDLPTLWE